MRRMRKRKRRRKMRRLGSQAECTRLAPKTTWLAAGHRATAINEPQTFSSDTR
jgi:hypothetical protein